MKFRGVPHNSSVEPGPRKELIKLINYLRVAHADDVVVLRPTMTGTSILRRPSYLNCEC